jgi:hypothetical protein
MVIACRPAVAETPHARTLEESSDIYGLAAGLLPDLLPTSLRPFFQAHAATLRETACSPGGESGAATTLSDASCHYVLLDVEASGDEVDARREAAKRFPHNRGEAKSLYERKDVADGGWLPWIVEERYVELVRAFRDGPPEPIAKAAGLLLHFAMDSALPFNTTAQREGSGPHRLQWSDAEGPPESRRHRTVRHRCQVVLPHRLRDRLQYEVRVSPDRVGPTTDPVGAVFEVLLNAHGAVESLIDLDSSVTAELGLRDAEAFVAASDDYYAKLADRAAPILETQIEAGALLTARLMVAAWTAAGSPTMPGPPSVVASPAASSQSPNPPSAMYVGSRNSTIFHLATCSHAARIKPENRVYFDSLKQAVAANRMPCKVCGPAAISP